MALIRLPGRRTRPTSPRRRRPQGATLRAAVMLLAALLLAACAGPQRDPSVALSLRAQRLCRERMAELPPGTNARQARLSYARCLRSLDLEAPAAQGAPAPGEAAQAPSAAPGAAEGLSVSAEERYLHCRLHSEEIAAAAAAYNQARWALLNSGGEAGSPERQQAEAELDRALQELGRAIPERLRAGRDLVPDALRQYQSCERSNFE